jgi:uncharacterized protein YhbP (UPF0306 family)
MDSNTEAAVVIIRANRYLTLATGLDESVWAAPLAYVVDENLRFYWYSALEARHSQHIASNPSVAAAIFNSTVSSESADGVQLEGVAALVPAEDLDQIEDLPVYKSLPIFWASYYFCAPGDLTLLYEVYRLLRSRRS